MHDEFCDVIALYLNVDGCERPGVKHGFPHVAVQLGASDVKRLTGQCCSDRLDHDVIHAVYDRLGLSDQSMRGNLVYLLAERFSTPLRGGQEIDFVKKRRRASMSHNAAMVGLLIHGEYFALEFLDDFGITL